MNELTFKRASADNADAIVRTAGADGARQDSLPALLRYLRIVKRWKWLILGVLAVSIIVGLTVSLLMTPQYTSVTTIEIQRENDRIVNVQGVEPESRGFNMEFYQTQYGLLKARSLAERVARDLRLADNVAFFAMYGANKEAEQLQEAGPAASAPGQRNQRLRRASEILLANVSIVPGRLSQLVDIEYTSADPELSARIVNAWTRHFIESTLARKFEATSYARTFLEQRLNQLRQRLEESERLLVGYASRERIINIPTSTSATYGPGGTIVERPLVAEDLSSLNAELNSAIAARVSAESRLRGSGGSTTEALQSQAISLMRSRRTELASEQARLLTQFEPNYPPAQALANQIAEIDRSIAREEGRVRNTLREVYQSAAARETALRAQVQGLQGDLLNLRGRTIQYNIFQRDVDTNRQLYDALLQRYKEIGVAGGVGVNNISVVDPGQAPETPSSPRILLNMLLSLLVGSVAAAGLAVALDQVDEAISDPTDVERMFGLPLLGTIPRLDNADPLQELEDRKSALVEAYLSTQTSLSFTTDHGVPRTLAVTSTRPSEGKSTTTFALARSLARTGRSVILVDADMRSPSLHHFFGVQNTRGLSNYLTGGATLSELIMRKTPQDVALLTAGPPPPNAAELLTGDRINDLLRELSNTYDHVLLDVPPVVGLADTPLIASRVEGTMFVIESHATRLSAARVAIGRLQDAQARVIGVLLTKFQSKRAHYGYGYEYGYGYGDSGKDTA
jgi:succinoglycan biosynthesis transport protein ExoP